MILEILEILLQSREKLFYARASWLSLDELFIFIDISEDI